MTTAVLANVLFATAVGNADVTVVVAAVVIGGVETVGAGVVGIATDELGLGLDSGFGFGTTTNFSDFGLIAILGWVCGMLNLFCHNKLAV